MRSLAVFGFAAAASAGHLSVSLTRQRSKLDQFVTISRRDDAIPLEALNNITGGGYYSEFSIGTPPQKLNFHLDTGSSDTWVNSVDSDLCQSDARQQLNGYCSAQFNPDDSSTYELVDRDGFNITYLDGRNILGDYFNDTVTIGDIKVENQQLGLATTSVRGTGLMGLGYRLNVASAEKYPTILDNMVSQGIIGTHAFSMYLNDILSDSGSILFGAIDSNKYIGDLAILPIVPDSSSGSGEVIPHYSVRLDDFSVNVPSGESQVRTSLSSSAAAILDSGSTISIMPDSAVRNIFDTFGVVSVPGSLSRFADCAWAGDRGEDYSFDFEFDGKVVRVPMREMIVDAFSDLEKQALKRDTRYRRYFSELDEVCMFGLTSSSEFGIRDSGFVLLGDTFLRSAYVVYDQVNNEIGIAQANLRSTEEDIHEFSDNSRIPRVAGVESQQPIEADEPNRNSSGGSDDDDDDDNSGSGSGNGNGSGGDNDDDDDDSSSGNGNGNNNGNGNGDDNDNDDDNNSSGNGNGNGNGNNDNNGNNGNGGGGSAAGHFSPSVLATVGLFTFAVGFGLL